MQKYEVGIYNQTVRDLLAEDEHHRHLDDKWADVYYFEVKAASADAARAKMASSHPASQGYVIESVEEVVDNFD